LARAESDIPPDLQNKAFASFMQQYDQFNGQKSQLFDGVREFLETCRSRQMKMAIVTNKPIRFTHSLLAKLKIDHYFCDAAGGDSFTEKKPHPMPLLQLIRRNGSQRPIMIGDSIHDVQAARAAGIPVIGVNYGYNHGADIALSGPDLVVDSLAALG
jgi:phosphoglycolate phosphatase